MDPRRLIALLVVLLGLASSGGCISHSHVSQGVPVASTGLILCRANYAEPKDGRATFNCRVFSEQEFAHAPTERQLYAVGAQPPIINPLWNQPTWCVDGGNISGCASDKLNDGAVCACGASGHGPLVTVRELTDHRWGCAGATECPRVTSASMTITLASSQVGGDVFTFQPTFEGGGPIVLQGALGAAQTIGTGTLAGVTLSTRTNNAPPAKATLTPSGGSVALHQLIFDSTANAYFWVTKSDGANVWELSNPIAAFNLSTPNVLQPAVTISNGDAYTIYRPVTSTPLLVKPRCGNTATNLNLYHLTLWNDQTTMTTGPNVNVIESAVNAYWKAVDPITNLVPMVFNSDTGFFVQSAADKQAATGYAFIGGQNIGGNYMIGDIVIDGDFVIANGGVIGMLSGTVGTAFVGPGSTISIDGLVLAVANDISGSVYNGGIPVWYGPGQAFVHGGGHLYYPGGANKAATTFPLAGGLRQTGPKSAFDTSVDPAILHPRADDGHAFVLDLDLPISSGGYGMGASSNCSVAPDTSICNQGP
jgi:hypothetical protein